MLILVVAAAIALAAFTYLGLERLDLRRAWPALAGRAVAWAAVGVLLLNLSCPVRGTSRRPLVLLDASLSLSGPGGRWAEARDSALRLGEVRTFGDERTRADTVPARGRSLLAPALVAASASDRPVFVVTDGEIEDAADLPADVVARATVRLFPRAARFDVALIAVEGPSRITAGDSIVLEVEVVARGGPLPDTIALEVTSGQNRVGRGRARTAGDAVARGRVVVGSRGLPAGDHLLHVAIAPPPGDAEPRTDVRIHRVTVTPTPGVVLLATPGDWDARFLYRALRDVSQLPVRGYVQLEPEQWRSMADLGRVPAQDVRQAARGADLLVLKGATGSAEQGTRARAIFRWPSGEGSGDPLPGDWYLAAAGASPIAGAFLGQPVDSFPPAVQLVGLEPPANAWVALSAQLDRRGAQRPALFGFESGRTRQVTVAIDGLWRWAFRGGSSEQAYRALVAASVSWLLGAADSARGAARVTRPVVQNGRPLVFEWAAPGAARPLPVAWSAEAGLRNDTLRFDGTGRAEVWLEPGEYRYRFEGGGSGAVAVERYSDELIPREPTLRERAAPTPASERRSAARDWLWLFALAVVAFSAEWFARRRLGLR